MSKWRKWTSAELRVAFWAFAIMVSVTLILIVKEEWVVGLSPIRYARAIIVVAIVGAGSVIYFRCNSPRDREFGWDSALTILSVGGLLYGGLTFATPVQSDDLSIRACPGVAVRQATAYVQTPDTGLTVRDGASIISRQVGSLPPNCGIGVDAYCPGDPVRDVNATGRFDPRWLLVHQRDEDAPAQFISASQVFGLLQDGVVDNYDDLDRSGAKGFCKRHDGSAAPGRVEVYLSTASVEESDNKATILAIEAKDTYQFGVAVYFPQETNYGSRYMALPHPVPDEDQASPRASLTLTTDMITDLAPESASEPVTVIVARCWGIGAAVLDELPSTSPGRSWLGRYNLASGDLEPLHSAAIPQLDVRRAEAKACSEAAEIPASVSPEAS